VTSRVFLAVVLGAILAGHGRADAQVPPAWIGTWTLNLAASTYNPGPPPFKRAMCRIQPWKDGVRVTYDMVRRRGGVTHLEWTGKLDGRDYTVEGVDRVVTNAYRRIDERTFAITTTVDGEIAEAATLAISPDGRTMTIATTRKNEADTTTMVYEKR
jgi:hypothetical protein